MVRISGVNIPEKKLIYISLTYIYGIGHSTSKKILKQAGIPYNTRCNTLDREQVKRINRILDENYEVEGELRSKIFNNIKQLINIKCYRGLRHIKKLPVRGQRTHTNARTRKGKALAIASKKVTK